MFKVFFSLFFAAFWLSEVYADDHIPWSFEMPSRLLAVGDIHGELIGLLQTLIQQKIISPVTGEWLAKDTIVVLTGDLVDRGHDSKAVMDTVLFLEHQAKLHGSQLISLLGNHEFFFAERNHQFMNIHDIYRFNRFSGGSFLDLEHATEANSVYMKWFRERNSLVRVGDNLFAHAGIHEWGLKFTPMQVNYWLRQWMAHANGLISQPPDFSIDLINSDGPIQTRALSSESDFLSDSLPPAIFREVLDKYQSSRIVFGHTPTENNNFYINFDHPLYKGAAIEIDTKAYDPHGRWMALEIGRNRLAAHEIAKETLPKRFVSAWRQKCHEFVKSLASSR